MKYAQNELFVSMCNGKIQKAVKSPKKASMDETLCLKSQLLFDEPEKNVVFFSSSPNTVKKLFIYVCFLAV